ncbi:DUF3558 family protein [Nocardia sp. CDC153]|uniref:DUF3558 family protein n=1 Tax=Nocardia sp. CDC153 TaxID=3112167 RepID=UPI002DBE986D|nr:DUF3558 family protein [Nocardia sp. CDC153]MEC3956972.1 DUF3558 family protein [Nocardia sp. CDC153]
MSSTVSIATLTLLTLTGCGGETSSATPGTSVAAQATTVAAKATTGFTKDPCSLLTSAEIAQALGADATAAPSTGAVGQKKCDWNLPGDTTGIPGLSLSYFSPSLATAFANAMHRHEPLAQNERQVDVGDGAILETAASIIDVLVGDSVFRVTGYSQHPISDDTLTSLARAAAARLP